MQEAAGRIGHLQQLPFRMKQSGSTRYLEYEQRSQIGAGRFVDSVNTIFDYGPPFAQILELMTMYRELEGSVSGIKAERDELDAKLVTLTGEHERLQKRCDEFKRRAEGGKRGNGE
jgi:hypothetical protein